MIKEFTNSDSAYLEWVSENPKGFVVNCRRKISSHYMVLHSCSCALITVYKGRSIGGGFTERSYIKICSDDYHALEGWLQSNGAKDFSKVCNVCLGKTVMPASAGMTVGVKTL